MWGKFLRSWRDALDDGAAAAARMNAVNPKFIPREWMLVEAYTAAQGGDYSLVNSLHELFMDPYGEGSAEDVELYYRRAGAKSAKGGVAYMS